MPHSFSTATRLAVVTLRSQGYSWGAITQQLPSIKSRSSAQYIWNSRYRWDRPTQGRKPVVTPHMAKRIDKAIANDPWASPKSWWTAFICACLFHP